MICVLGNTLGLDSKLEGSIERVNLRYTTFQNDILSRTQPRIRWGQVLGCRREGYNTFLVVDLT